MDKRRLVTGLLWDVGLPAVVYYVCRTFGVDALPALGAGGVVALIRVGWVALTRRRLDGLAAFVGVTFVVLLVVSLLTGDPRILLAREPILSGAAGLVLLGSCVIRRPVLYAAARRLSAGKDAQWQERWRTQPAFRRIFFLMSGVWGAGLVVEAVVQLQLIYLLPIDTMAGVSTALRLGTIALLVGWTLWYRARRRRAALSGHIVSPAEPERTRAG